MWQVDVRLPNGDRIRRSKRTRREANDLERELLAQIADGALTSKPAREQRFSKFAPEVMDVLRSDRAAKTMDSYESRLKCHLMPYFGNYRISDIGVAEIERFKGARLKAGAKARALNLDLTVLSIIFRHAVKVGVVRSNPVRDVGKLKQPKRPPRFLSEDEVSRFLAAAKETHLYGMMVCAVTTGMRKSELFHLKWSSVDFDRSVVTVQSASDGWHTKNYDFREIDLCPLLRDVLRELWEYRLPDEEHVFTYRGKPYQSSVKRTFGAILERAGIENCTLHTLRHTFASHLAIQGVPLMHIQKLMGHQDYAMTLVYAHLSRESVRGHVSALPFGGLDDDTIIEV